MMKRLQWVGFTLYHSIENAQPFLKHFMALLPSLDSELSLFKKLTICTIRKEPLNGKIKKETTSAETKNLKIGEMEVEEEEEVVANPVPALLTMLKRITTLLVEQMRLFQIDITHYHPDILPLFTPVNSTVFLFSVEEPLTLSLLSFLKVRNSQLIAKVYNRYSNLGLMIQHKKMRRRLVLTQDVTVSQLKQSCLVGIGALFHV